MVHIALIDDDAEERRSVRDCLDFITSRDGTEFAVKEFTDGESFLGTYEPGYDIVLMDIDMPGLDGVSTAQKLRKIDKSVVLMFVTRMPQFAVRGYEVDALDFIVKPINKYGFALKMSRAIARSAVLCDDVYLLRSEGEIVSIRLNMLRYAETEGHYVVYHTVDGDYREYAYLKSVEKRVGKNFVRCNSCYLVNLRYVTGVRKNTVIVGGEELAISRPKKAAFLAALSAFVGGGLS